MSAEDYDLLIPIEKTRARFRFNGPFLGQEVTWDAELLTLAAMNEQLGLAGKSVPEYSARSIDIGSEGPKGIELRVVLNVDEINETVIAKTMIMIRHYRFLSPGHHEFGRDDCK